MSKLDIIIPLLRNASKPRASKAGTTIRACCPACGGDNRSKMVATETGGGRLLLHCFEGCGAGDIAAAVGLDLSDLMPDTAPQRNRTAIPINRRHDAAHITGIAIELMRDAEMLLFQHSITPIPSIHERLMQTTAQLATARRMLESKVQESNHD